MNAHTHRAEIATVPFGNKRIGPYEPVFVIAEAGVNHNGKVDLALELIDIAVEAGADAVKFQMFRAADLVTATAPTATYQRLGARTHSQRAMLAELELSAESFSKLRERCDRVGLMMLATPFSVADVERVVDLGVPGIKIASTDLSNNQLRSAVIETTLPVIHSTGASKRTEIAACVKAYGEAGAADRLVLLHCVSSYPTRLEVVNLRSIETLQHDFSVPVGFSDHTRSVHAGGWAVAAGACVLEKHFTTDKTLSGPDHAMSLSPDELHEYIQHARDCTKARGDGRLGMRACEKEVRRVASKSVVTSVNIPRGARLTPDMLTLKRPGTGIPAKDVERVEGKTATEDIPVDTLLSWDMVQ